MDAPNKKWVTDITKFKMLGTKQFLSPVIDYWNVGYIHSLVQ